MKLFDGFDGRVDTWLGLDDAWAGQAPRYQHVTTLNRLAAACTPLGAGNSLVEGLLAGMEDNLRIDGQAARPSVQNWRYAKQLNLADENRNPETLLERVIADLTDRNWVNQVPTVSGVAGEFGQPIDLVHREGREFEFIELKVGANTPLAAAVQVLRYGLAYALTRPRAQDWGYENCEVMQASAIHLRVLAPASYYESDRGVDWTSWLRSLADCWGLDLNQLVADRGLGFTMSFQFLTFPAGFTGAVDSRNMAARQELLWMIHNVKTL